MVTQDGKMLVHTLLFVGAYLIYPSSAKATPERLRVNEKAVSRVLNQTRLAKLGEAWPAWKTPPMTWPSPEEVARHSVQVDPSVRGNCIKWLAKFMKDESRAQALEDHLVAMPNWGLFWERLEQEPLCDVFICRFVQGPYVIHVQESPADVVISVADERLAENPKPQTAHADFIVATASAFLHQDLVPDRERYWFQFEPKTTANGGAITSVQWLPPSVANFDKKRGVGTVDTERAGKIGTYEILAETDGAFVRFDILKCVGVSSRLTMDPYVRRFPVSK